MRTRFGLCIAVALVVLILLPIQAPSVVATPDANYTINLRWEENNEEIIVTYAPSSDLVYENNAEVSSTSDSYVKVKEWQIDGNGEIKIDFELRTTAGGATGAYGRIYRNGVAVGTERATSSTTYVTFTENLSGWSNGDNVQLYIHRTGTYTAYNRNFMVYGETDFEATLTAYLENYGLQENKMTHGTLENVTYPERPYWLQLKDDNYWRGRIPTADNGTITFWLTDSPTAYTLSLVDYVGGFGHPDGQLIIKPYMGDNIINEDRWSADRTMFVYLIQGKRYSLQASKTGETRSIGPFDATSDTTKEISIGWIMFENVTYIHNIIAWSATFDGENITVSYQDNTENTDNANMKIYDLDNGDFMYDENFAIPTWSTTWTDGNENCAYKVVLTVTAHPQFETFQEIKLLGQPSEYWDVPVDGFEGMLGSAPASLVAIGSIVLLIFVGATFSGISAGFGTIVIALAAIMLYAFGWLPVEWGVLIFVLFIAFLLKFGRRG